MKFSVPLSVITVVMLGHVHSVHSGPKSPRCVTSCYGLSDGMYQSCDGCSYFLECSNGILYDKRPCPFPLFWDDEDKRCAWLSTTCVEPDPDTRCVSNCQGMPTGHYQSCESCRVYVKCRSGRRYANKKCSSGLVWDDDEKSCRWTSNTCFKTES